MTNVSQFHDVVFPTDVAFGAQRSVSRPVEIVTLGSGREHRNQRWHHSKRKYDAGFGIKTLSALQEVASFFEARRGPFTAFRFRDPLDWKSCKPNEIISSTDQELGLGDGETLQFQLTKLYGESADAYRRPISLPVIGTVLVAVDGVEKTEGTHFSVNGVAGHIDFLPAHVPTSGEQITSGFAFDVPVRFLDDELTINLAAFDAGDIPSIPLLEVKL